MNIYRLAHKSIVGRVKSVSKFFFLPTYFFLSRKKSKVGFGADSHKPKTEVNDIVALGHHKAVKKHFLIISFFIGLCLKPL